MTYKNIISCCCERCSQLSTKHINDAIEENVQGRGGQVYGINTDTVVMRIFKAKNNRGAVMGKSLSSGKWFRLAGWEVR